MGVSVWPSLPKSVFPKKDLTPTRLEHAKVFQELLLTRSANGRKSCQQKQWLGSMCSAEYVLTQLDIC